MQVSHDPQSRVAAVDLTVQDFIPRGLTVVEIVGTDIVRREVTEDENGTYVSVTADVFEIGDQINIIYSARLDPDLPVGESLSTIVTISYSNIEQEGIGLLVS